MQIAIIIAAGVLATLISIMKNTGCGGGGDVKF